MLKGSLVEVRLLSLQQRVLNSPSQLLPSPESNSNSVVSTSTAWTSWLARCHVALQSWRQQRRSLRRIIESQHPPSPVMAPNTHYLPLSLIYLLEEAPRKLQVHPSLLGKSPAEEVVTGSSVEPQRLRYSPSLSCHETIAVLKVLQF